MIRGAEGVFCSGADLKYIRAGGDGRELGYLRPETRDVPARGYGEVFKQILEYLHSTISEIRRAPKPFIAAVDGVAAAGGFGLAMACDLVLASQRASFEWAYVKTGLTGAESSTFFLPELIGLRRAMELVLLNPRLDCRRGPGDGSGERRVPTERFEAEVLIAGTPARRRPHRGVRRRQRLDQPGGGRRSTRRPSRPRAGEPGAHRRQRRLRRRASTLLRQAAGAISRIVTMHEYSIVRALLDRVEAEAQARKATAVRHIRVRIGELAGVDPELLLYRLRRCCASARSAQEAELEIDPVDGAVALPALLRDSSRAALSCAARAAAARRGWRAETRSCSTESNMEVP